MGTRGEQASPAQVYRTVKVEDGEMQRIQAAEGLEVLKPELGAGYRDFTMADGLRYTVRLAADPSAVVSGLAVEPCTDDDGQRFSGGWRLVFQGP